MSRPLHIDVADACRAAWSCSRHGDNKVFLRFFVSLIDPKRKGLRSNPCELPLFSLIIELHFSIESIQKEANMRTKLIVLSLTAALIAVGGVAFEANATMGVGTESLSARAKSYSPIERASCNGQGLFCQAGSSLQC